MRLKSSVATAARRKSMVRRPATIALCTPFRKRLVAVTSAAPQDSADQRSLDHGPDRTMSGIELFDAPNHRGDRRETRTGTSVTAGRNRGSRRGFFMLAAADRDRIGREAGRDLGHRHLVAQVGRTGAPPGDRMDVRFKDAPRAAS